jgi:HemY protein
VTRLISILVVAGLIASAIAWLADNDGVATVMMAGYEVRMSASIAILFGVALAVVIAIVIRVAFFLIGSPAKFNAWSSQRRARKFFQSLSRGLIAAASGDAEEAALFARRADKLLRGQPLSLLLSAQAGELSGDEKKQEAAYRDMLRFPDTEFLGLRGLFELAMRHHDETQALAHATRAYAMKPQAWALNGLFDLRVSRREWREAIQLVVQATRNRALAPEVARRRRAVLLAAQAVEAERAGDAAALEHALESISLAPGLTTPALIAARHLTAQGRSYRAQAVIEAAWTEAPHRDLAAAYAAIHPKDAPEERAERLIALCKLNTMHRESRVLMAEQWVTLKRWEDARNLLQPMAEDFSSARVCALMAEIAQGEQDALTAQMWRSRAGRGHRIADWRCARCNTVAPEWSAVCAHCSAFDAIRWSASAAAEAAARITPVQIPAPPVRPGSPAGGPIVDAASRGPRLRVAARREEPSSFVRPDDPGPGTADLFGGTPPSEEQPPEPAETKTR